jgi:hypothetical protein
MIKEISKGRRRYNDDSESSEEIDPIDLISDS